MARTPHGMPPTLRIKAPDVDRFIRTQDQAAFALTAWHFHVHIIVRRSNPASIGYIGRPGFEAKGVEVKAKTCQRDTPSAANLARSQVGGLVANPYLVGRFAYASQAKFEKAKAEWDAFVRTGRLDADVSFGEDGTPSKLYLAPGCRFCVDTDPTSARYGALMRSSSGLVTAAKYLHGDYDLFAIIPADAPTSNIVVAEQHLASPLHPLNAGSAAYQVNGRPQDAEIRNFRGQKFMDVQMMLNRRMGAQMILHGSQEKAVNSFDEEVDVFLADGETSFSILSEGGLRHFYEVVLGGRKLHNFMAGPPAGDRTRLPDTLWETIGSAPTGPVTPVDLYQCRANWRRIS